jgi:hypothetical protein
MAVDAARTVEDLGYLGKQRTRPRILVGDTLEGCRGTRGQGGAEAAERSGCSAVRLQPGARLEGLRRGRWHDQTDAARSWPLLGTCMIQECIIIRTGPDTFDVIVGRRLNDRPLSRAEADHLAHARRRYQTERRKVGWPSTTTSPARETTLPRMGRLVRASATGLGKGHTAA